MSVRLIGVKKALTHTCMIIFYFNFSTKTLYIKEGRKYGPVAQPYYNSQSQVTHNQIV